MNLKFTDQNLQDIKTVAGASEWGLRDAFFGGAVSPNISKFKPVMSKTLQ